MSVVPASAHAQTSGTVSLVSDYRYRGVSLSDGKPAAQLGLAYDDASGWYAGVFASTIRFASPDSRGAQTQLYAGYAHRIAPGITIEGGADYAVYSVGRSYEYPEIYVGFTLDNVSGRLFYATRHFAGSGDTFYAELNGATPLGERMRLVAHAGALRNPVEDPYYPPPRFVFDGRAGIAFDVDRFVVQIAWVGVSSTGAYPMSGARRHTAVLSVSLAF
jgi:uncharacterized protein (TIGR02001 family)